MNKITIQEIKSKDKKCPVCGEQAKGKVDCKIEGKKYCCYLCDSCLNDLLKEWMDSLFSDE